MPLTLCLVSLLMMLVDVQSVSLHSLSPSSSPVFDTEVFLAVSSSPCLVNKYTTFDLLPRRKTRKTLIR